MSREIKSSIRVYFLYAVFLVIGHVSHVGHSWPNIGEINTDVDSRRNNLWRLDPSSNVQAGISTHQHL